VNEDCLKVTAYFGERHRVEGRFYADLLLDVLGRGGVATSILLRGTAGFGLRHRLRTDQSLSMSEDPSMMVIGVDSRPRIEGLLPQVQAIPCRGLLTVERARLLEADQIELPQDRPEATKLTVYVGRQDRIDRRPAYVAICDLFHRRGLSGASVLLGVDGTAHGERKRAKFFDRNDDVPVMVVAVAAGDRVSAVLPDLGALLRHPLLTVERVRVCKRDGELLERPHMLPSHDDRGLPLWQKLTVFTSESRLHQGMPIHRALVRRMRATSAAPGVTAVRGIWGFHGDHEPHGDRLLQIGRRVPVATIVVARPDQMAQCFAIIDEVTDEHGLVTVEMVPAAIAMDGSPAAGRIELADHDY
jgi:PII-like signaling protein